MKSDNATNRASHHHAGGLTGQVSMRPLRGIIFTMLVFLFLPGCPMVWGTHYQARITACLADTISSRNKSPSTGATWGQFPDGIVVVPFLSWRGAMGHSPDPDMEFLSAQMVTSEDDCIQYPFRLHLHVIVPFTLAASYPPYPGVVAFAENCAPAFVSVEMGTDSDSCFTCRRSKRRLDPYGPSSMGWSGPLNGQTRSPPHRRGWSWISCFELPDQGARQDARAQQFHHKRDHRRP